MRMLRSKALRSLVTCVVLFQSGVLAAGTVDVRRTEGAIHGFLTLRTLEGELVANGDLIQVARGGRVTNQLIFRFKDGSLHHETAVFSQDGTFRLVSDHLVQKG